MESQLFEACTVGGAIVVAEVVLIYDHVRNYRLKIEDIKGQLKEQNREWDAIQKARQYLISALYWKAKSEGKPEPHISELCTIACEQVPRPEHKIRDNVGPSLFERITCCDSEE